VQTFELKETIAALRAELLEAITDAEDQEFHFPLGPVQLEFQVGVTKNVSGDGKVQFWVLELGASGSYANETIQKITLTLEPPVDADGEPVKVARHFRRKP
jgi:Trypsin-co-occurring domain 2